MNRVWIITVTEAGAALLDEGEAPEAQVIYGTEDAAYAAFGRMCQRLGAVGDAEVVERALVGDLDSRLVLPARPTWLDGLGPWTTDRHHVRWMTLETGADGFSTTTSDLESDQDVMLAQYVTALVNAHRIA